MSEANDSKHEANDSKREIHLPKLHKPRPRTLRLLAYFAASLIAFLLVLFLGGWYYTTTADFQRRVGGEVVSVLEDATGGKVELGHISFNLLHLAIEADGLVIHGTEAPGEAPYLSAAKIFIRLRINTFISHTVGRGAQSHVGVNFLRVEQPHVHLIIDKDGKTNQPVPKKASTSTEPVQNTLLDLQAGQVELADGLAVVNDRAIPFDLAARNLNAEVHYISSADHYGATVDLADLRTKNAKQPEVQSHLHLTAELGRDMFALQSFDFFTGTNSHLSANALVQHFANPEWQGRVNGSLDLRQLGYLGNIDGFTAGTVALDINGRNCEVAPQTAQKSPHFWQRRTKKSTAADPKMLPPSADCKAGYLLVGKVKVSRAGLALPSVRAHDVDAGADLHVTPTELLFTALTSTLPGGGTIAGQLKIENWLGEVPADTAAGSATTVAAAKTANNVAKGTGAAAPIQSMNITQGQRAHAYLDVAINRITLRTILDITGPQPTSDLGLDTQVSGPVNVEWGGPASDMASSVQVAANLHLTPTGVPRPGARENVPVTGAVIAKFDGRTQLVTIQTVHVQTPATNLDVTGVLGVSGGDPLTNLAINLQAHDLGEFDSVLQSIGFENNGKKGSAALPIILHGTLDFFGTAKGVHTNLDVKGHLEADNLEAHLGTLADAHIDSIVADAEYSPNGGFVVASSTIKRQTAVLNVSGAFHPHRVVSRRGYVSYEWDGGAAVDATVKLANAQTADLLQIAGQQDKIKLTGVANIDGHVSGTFDSLNGAGHIALTNGTAYGEGFTTIAADASIAGQQVTASRFLVALHGMQVTGNGAYNLASKHLTAHVEGDNLRLSNFDLVRNASVPADGVLNLKADADGTAEQPNLRANFSLSGITVEGKPVGQLTATAHSTGSTVFYDVHSALVGASLEAAGQTSLVGNYDTQAKLTLSGLDIAKPLALFAPTTIHASSNIAATINVSGPAANPQQLTGIAEFTAFDMKLEGVELAAAQPIRASLRNGLLNIDALHITGQDTDLRAGGTARIFGDTNPQGGVLALNADGSISIAIAHTFDHDIISSGKVNFKVAAGGRIKSPQLTGDVNFVHVNLAVDGIPNGLTDLNGSLAFNQNRLDVKDLVGTTGGGKLRIGGSLSYQQKGIFADLTASGDNVRVRLYGLSATANAQFRLQGGPQSALLSGTVLITRFGVGADVDFAAFAGAGGVQAPPDPDAAANKIRMDIHVTSAPQLDFQNAYAKLAGTVDLTIRGTVADPTVLGRIQITDGSATFAGTTYQLQRGTVYFSNPVRIDPVIDLDATARVNNYDITISLHGTATSLKPTYRSEPPLTEADIFSLLALGRTQEQAQLYQEQQVQAGTDPTTSSVLGGALNATVSSRVNKLFGGGSVKIDPSFVGTLGNSAARITVSEPITKQLTLVFATNVNQSAQQLIQVQYQINDATSLVATRDETGVFSIVYKIRKRYR
jgi:translocation and assembly module TamB